ncbi:MAG: amino acid ABC transporter permease [Chloroflexi bacterium]|nr:amino acid ABC transporter permease [Chloroflexota bacterium]
MDEASFGLMMSGLRTTMWLSVTSIIASLILGTIIGVLRVSPIPLLRKLAGYYVEFFRNIPLLTVLFFVFLGLPETGITFSIFNSGLVGLSIYTAAYVAEVVRAGLQSISHGQTEAARSLGLSYTQTLQYILLPQTFRITIPPLGNLFIALVKNTSIASAIVVPEIMYQAQVVEGRTFNSNIFLFAGLLYLVITIPLGLLVNVTEQRLRLPERSNP